MLRSEMFENSPSEMPLCSNIMSSAPPFTNKCEIDEDSAWGDLQGAIRLTMVSGSLTVTSVTVQVVKAGPSLSSDDIYSTTFVPITEPRIALTAVLRGGKVIVSWPQEGANGLHLQAATNLSTPKAWSGVTNTVFSFGTNYYTTNDISGPTQFFRLRSLP
jgi:hypothetical protein